MLQYLESLFQLPKRKKISRSKAEKQLKSDNENSYWTRFFCCFPWGNGKKKAKKRKKARPGKLKLYRPAKPMPNRLLHFLIFVVCNLQNKTRAGICPVVEQSLQIVKLIVARAGRCCPEV
jgi:hypothetical protein